MEGEHGNDFGSFAECVQSGFTYAGIYWRSAEKDGDTTKLVQHYDAQYSIRHTHERPKESIQSEFKIPVVKDLVVRKVRTHKS